MDTTATAPTVDSGDALAERIVGLVNASMQVDALYLGDRLGWYRALADGQPRTADELAAATGTDARYALEWLEHQVACAVLDLHDAGDGPARFSLPPGHAEVLTDPDSLAFALPFATFAASRGRQLDELVAAYRSGGGIAWDEMGHVARESQGAANRPFFLHALGQDVLPAIPDLHERLSRPGARIVDVGCGFGWSSVALARTYPHATIHAVDVDRPSVEAARRHAAEAGVGDRVQVTHGDPADLLGDTYDAVFAFECIHDMPEPVRVLDVMRQLAGEDGAVVVMDERVADRLEGPADEIEQLMYGFSLTCCLPDGRSHEHSAATGTVMRHGTLRAYAADAGLPRCDTLPIDLDFFRFYRLA
jgi:SAM-dependent methyltransferase